MELESTMDGSSLQQSVPSLPMELVVDASGGSEVTRIIEALHHLEKVPPPSLC